MYDDDWGVSDVQDTEHDGDMFPVAGGHPGTWGNMTHDEQDEYMRECGATDEDIAKYRSSKPR